MEFLGINIDIKNSPALDKDFIPVTKFADAFSKGAQKPVAFALEGADGQVAVKRFFIHGTPEMAEADLFFSERTVKAMLWMYGGHTVHVWGDEAVFRHIKAAYAPGGAREFDADFMSRVFEHPFEVLLTENLPEENTPTRALGRHLNGCRVGFDAGGSDRKVSAVIDGVPVYSEETVWFPKTESNPDYHYDGIVAAFRAAKEKLPRVDAVGISSAGIYIGNSPRIASLFIKVSAEDFAEKVKNIYVRAVHEVFGESTPFAVCNDGDVSALAGAMGLGENNVLGVAMGTSQAVGYVNAEGNITGWLNEHAFMPVDFSPDAMADEWSGDIGCGVKYFSQDGVSKLAPRAGISLDEALSPAEKLKAVQTLLESGDKRAEEVFRTIGAYLGHTLPYYYELYGCKHVLLLGRVLSGRGGDIILEEAKRICCDEYPECRGKIFAALPDEKTRRVGQSVAAASLPEV